MLFGGYRRGDANDPDTYVAAIAAVLADYSEEVIRRVTDPRTGISQSDFMDGRFRSFMPNSGELKAYCDQQESKLERERHLQSLPLVQFLRLPPPRRAPLPGDLANVLVLNEAPQYAAMVERAKTAEQREWRWDDGGRGIWVTLSWTGPEAGAAKKLKRFTDEELREIYRPKAESVELEP